ncbi:MAG: hypothetical protein ACPGUV_01540 [Polyangiales bacterium]
MQAKTWMVLAVAACVAVWALPQGCGGDGSSGRQASGDCAAGEGVGELCDGLDNDCDSAVDELVTQLCPGCSTGGGGSCQVWGDAATERGPWNITDTNAANFAGVVTDADGALTLNINQLDVCAVWIANTNDSTVSKLDCRSGEELARYPSVGALGPQGPGYDLGAVPSTTFGCSGDAAGNQGNCPSRTAVSQLGNAFVANRAFARQGSVTKYAATPALCRGSGNGTSRGSNVVAEDDCLLWTSAPEVFQNGKPRALAVGLTRGNAAEGDVWVGLFAKGLACALDPESGALIDLLPDDNQAECLSLDPDGSGPKVFGPYGAAADAQGRVWFVDRSAADNDILSYVDTRQSPPAVVAAEPTSGALSGCRTPYGIVVDGDDRIYVAINDCGSNKVLRYTPDAPAGTRWDSLATGGKTDPRGVAIGADRHLYAAISSDAANAVVRVSLDDPSRIQVETIPGSCTQAWGAGLAVDESIWAVCRGADKACRRDPLTGLWACHAVGDQPYSYSDIAGGNLNLLVEDNGFFQYLVEGCGPDMVWQGAGFRAEIPPGTRVFLEVRVADEPADFVSGAAGDFIGPFEVRADGGLYIADFTQAPGPVPRGRYLQVRLRLQSLDDMSAPRVLDLPEVVGTCAGTLL